MASNPKSTPVEIKCFKDFCNSEQSAWIFRSLVKEKVKTALQNSKENVFNFGMSNFQRIIKDSVAGILDINTNNFYSFENLPLEVIGGIEEYDKHIVKISILGAPVYFTLEDGTFHLMNKA